MLIYHVTNQVIKFEFQWTRRILNTYWKAINAMQTLQKYLITSEIKSTSLYHIGQSGLPLFFNMNWFWENGNKLQYFLAICSSFNMVLLALVGTVGWGWLPEKYLSFHRFGLDPFWSGPATFASIFQSYHTGMLHFSKYIPLHDNASKLPWNMSQLLPSKFLPCHLSLLSSQLI